MSEKFVIDVDTQQQVVAWQIKDNLTVEDVAEASALIKSAFAKLEKGKIKVLADNRPMVKNGHPIVFRPEVNAAWEELQKWTLGYLERVAVLCNGPLMKMQMDRVAKNSGIFQFCRHFWDDDANRMKEEAYAFLGIQNNRLLDA
jgi:hypothetical protein